MSAERRTLGELVGRLADLTIKLYMVQDKVIAAAKEGQALDAESARLLVVLNQERNATMTAIDVVLDRAVRKRKSTIDPRVKLNQC